MLNNIYIFQSKGSYAVVLVADSEKQAIAKMKKDYDRADYDRMICVQDGSFTISTPYSIMLQDSDVSGDLVLTSEA